MALGGARPGAGRKKGWRAVHTLSAEIAKKNLIEKYIKNADPINEALIQKALTGDIQAIRELHDRVFGKPQQSVDMTSKGESLVDEERVREAARKLNELRKLHS